eukprot:TRINITY_DN123181_c0_g1_i1.p1 TRINITY_DN123181_c0_g1~~TRINITY_DN123181_c0_g1_i1.p1  ORF type:complete len:415 (+),score=103.99 TRINITY_DN123181_c0_g1_i1:118-1362(+)
MAASSCHSKRGLAAALASGGLLAGAAFVCTPERGSYTALRSSASSARGSALQQPLSSPEAAEGSVFRGETAACGGAAIVALAAGALSASNSGSRRRTERRLVPAARESSLLPAAAGWDPLDLNACSTAATARHGRVCTMAALGRVAPEVSRQAASFAGRSAHLLGAVAAGSSSKVARHAALMPWKIPNTSQYQWLSVGELLLRERILFVSEYIDDGYANAIISMLLYLQSEDGSKPLQIYLSSPGAQLKPALALYDTIGQLKAKGCKVSTVCHSLCAGMSAFLAAAGTPGRRFATPNSLFLMTQTGLESPVQGQAEDIYVEAKQMLRETAAVEKEWSKLTGQPLEKIQKDLSRNFYLSAEQAKEYGIIDKVLKPNEDKGKALTDGVRDPWSGTITKEKVGFGVFADPNQPRTAV